MGRRLAFNLTLCIAGIFGIAAGAAPSWIGACGLFAALGTGVGGNLPVDGALFLEFLPNASGGLLTLLSVWWPVGQLVASLIGWGFLGGNYAVDEGWRYFVYTMGALTFSMFLARFLLFHLYESPKFLLSRGRQAEAVAVVHGMAHKNKTTTWLTEEILNEIGGHPEEKGTSTLSTKEIVRRKISSFSGDRIKPLFATRELGQTTALLWFCWVTIGMGMYPPISQISCPRLDSLMVLMPSRISPLQRLPPPIPRQRQRCRWRISLHKHNLPQLRHNIRSRCPRLSSGLLHRRPEVRGTERYYGY